MAGQPQITATLDRTADAAEAASFAVAQAEASGADLGGDVPGPAAFMVPSLTAAGPASPRRLARRLAEWAPDAGWQDGWRPRVFQTARRPA